MNKQIIVVLAVIAVATGVARAEVSNALVVVGGPLPVVLTGTVTGNDGAKIKLQAIQLTYAQTSFSTVDGTDTRSWLASSITTTNVADGTNTVTIVVGVSGTVLATAPNTGVVITKGTSGETADVFYDHSVGSSAGNVDAVLYIDAKFKTDKKTGDDSLTNAKVSGIWQARNGIIAGTLKPAK